MPSRTSLWAVCGARTGWLPVSGQVSSSALYPLKPPFSRTSSLPPLDRAKALTVSGPHAPAVLIVELGIWFFGYWRGPPQNRDEHTFVTYWGSIVVPRGYWLPVLPLPIVLMQLSFRQFFQGLSGMTASDPHFPRCSLPVDLARPSHRTSVSMGQKRFVRCSGMVKKLPWLVI
jgi:hypothetical protein